MFTSFKRIVRSGFVGFWRNAFVSFSAIFVITITLLVVGCTMLIGTLLDTALTQIQEKVDINVYLVKTASEDRIMALKASLESLIDVKEVAYTSREEVLRKFDERHQGDESTMEALEVVGDNPFGATLSVRAVETSHYESIASYLEEQRSTESPDAPLIDKINFNRNKEAIDKLTGIIHAIDRTSYIAMIVLVGASVLIAFNTIRLAIYTSREEIGVMRLVGASNMFIRGPFLIQGMLYGIISGVITLLILYPVTLWLGPGTELFFNLNIFNHFVNNFGYIFSVLVGAGVALGIASSILAIARYLRI